MHSRLTPARHVHPPRMPRQFRLFCVVASLCVLALTTPTAQARVTSAAPLAGSFAPGPCPIEPIAGLTIDCGSLTVAESRGKANSKTIQLAVAVLRSPNPARAADPVLFLQGGPGGATLALAQFVALRYAPVLAQRDIVLIDQRGTGFSRPALNCGAPATTTAMLRATVLLNGDRPAIVQQQFDVLLACGAALRSAGVDLASYNSVESAADLEDLRVALGYSAWNIAGFSYGTRLALTAMEYRPQTIRSVVLDSPYPRQANFHTDTFAGFQRSLERLFNDCAIEFACLAAYPNLAATFDTMVARLNTTPAQIPLRDPTSGQTVYVPLSGDDVVSVIFSLMYQTEVIPVLPLLINETAKGNYAFFTQLFNTPVPTQPISSLGTLVAVQCNEDVSFASARDFVVARDSNRRASPLAFTSIFNEGILEICTAWGLGTPAGVENTPVRSDVPTLLVRGAYDHVTQPEFATLAAQTLSRSFVLDPYPRGGHVVSLSSPCYARAVASFFDDPTKRPNTSCLASTEGPQPFFVR
ncbi:MAG: alpha/beta fold hydrolase [Roseiflexaceae bacterium]|nr:alpha/beta fold hydrolase [Roseiflexaceae bacterium]